MENEKLHFLDLANYLSRATSYAQFLASFAVGENKGFWPYDYITNIDQLNEPLPPIGPAWFSQLKNRSVLGTTPEEIQQNYKSVKAPLGKGRYEVLKRFACQISN